MIQVSNDATNFVIADISSESEIREFLQSMTKTALKDFLKHQCGIRVKYFDKTTKPKVIECLIKDWDKVLEGMQKKDS